MSGHSPSGPGVGMARMSSVVGAVDQPLQPAAHRLLREGVHHQHQRRGREAAFLRVAERKQVRQERQGEAIQFQRQCEQAGEHECGADDDADAEQVVGEDGIAYGCQEEDGGEGADMDEAEVPQP